MKEKTTSTAIKIALAEKHWKDFFLTEVKSGPTQLAIPGGLKILDGLAVRKSWTNLCFTGYEIKVSRSDFLRDAKFYTYEELCNCLYIVCPQGDDTSWLKVKRYTLAQLREVKKILEGGEDT